MGCHCGVGQYERSEVELSRSFQHSQGREVLLQPRCVEGSRAGTCEQFSRFGVGLGVDQVEFSVQEGERAACVRGCHGEAFLMWTSKGLLDSKIHMAIAEPALRRPEARDEDGDVVRPTALHDAQEDATGPEVGFLHGTTVSRAHAGARWHGQQE